MYTTVTLEPVIREHEKEFVEMATDHFRSLNPSFAPDQLWKDHYFRSCLEDPEIFLRWIVTRGERVGFVIFLIERHRFVPTTYGVIREVFVRTSHRRMGIASRCSELMIEQLKLEGVRKIFVDTVAGDTRAISFWQQAGFHRSAERLVLKS